MLKKAAFRLMVTASLIPAAHAAEIDGWDLFDWMDEALRGEWVLSPAEKQTGTDSYKHPAVLPLLGTDKPGIAFKLIGRETTIQEDLLPDTAKQMVTMYHCRDFACTTLKATHYCVKQNQPEFIANLEESTPTRFVFECDMSTELCRSDEDHVHRIVHELSENGSHLKTSYLSWENGKLKDTHSVYHFDRKR
jgi:hypothetical protein